MDQFIRSLEEVQKASAANNLEQTEAAVFQMFSIVEAEARKNPSPNAGLLEELQALEAQGDWAGVEQCRLKGLARAQESGNQMAVFKAQDDLNQHYRFLNEFEKAEFCAQAALEAADKSEMSPLTTRALQAVAFHASRRGDHAAALAAADRALALTEPGFMAETQLAGVLVTRARARLAAGDLAGCEADLGQSKPLLLDKEYSPIFAGIHSNIGWWWEVTAAVRAAKGELAAACEAWSEAMQRRRLVAALPQVAGPYTLAALARTLWRAGLANLAAGEIKAGESLQAEAKRLWVELCLPKETLE